MGLDIYKVSSCGNFIRIDGEIFDRLYPEFACETTVISFEKEDLEEVIQKEKDVEIKKVLKQILEEMGDEEASTFMIG